MKYGSAKWLTQLDFGQPYSCFVWIIANGRLSFLALKSLCVTNTRTLTHTHMHPPHAHTHTHNHIESCNLLEATIGHFLFKPLVGGRYSTLVCVQHVRVK